MGLPMVRPQASSVSLPHDQRKEYFGRLIDASPSVVRARLFHIGRIKQWYPRSLIHSLAMLRCLRVVAASCSFYKPGYVFALLS